MMLELINKGDCVTFTYGDGIELRGGEVEKVDLTKGLLTIKDDAARNNAFRSFKWTKVQNCRFQTRAN